MSGAAKHSPPATVRPRADHGAWPLTDTLDLGALPSAVPCARLHTRAILAEWGLAHLRDTAELVISELITNAVDASIVLPERPPIALRLLASKKSLVIEVWDHSPLDLEPRKAGTDAECGRGLTVVAAISDRWGWKRTGYQRKLVWAELATGAAASVPRAPGHGTTEAQPQ